MERDREMIKVTYIDHMGSDLSVVNAARVSFGKKSAALGYSGVGDENMRPILHDNDKKLIKYLAKHGHYSPFGHCFVSLFVKAPIYVHAQCLRHKFLRANTISRRYVDSEPEFYEPSAWRGRSADKKQGSDGVVEGIDSTVVESLLKCAKHDYNYLLAKGVCPEQARGILPQCTYTEWWWSGSLDAWSHMARLRCKPDTQLETRTVANEVSNIMLRYFPVSWEALKHDY